MNEQEKAELKRLKADRKEIQLAGRDARHLEKRIKYLEWLEKQGA